LFSFKVTILLLFLRKTVLSLTCMTKKFTEAPDDDCLTASEAPLSIADLSQLIARYKRAGYESFYAFQALQLSQNSLWAIESDDKRLCNLSK
jgi:hypothetical protein